MAKKNSAKKYNEAQVVDLYMNLMRDCDKIQEKDGLKFKREETTDSGRPDITADIVVEEGKDPIKLVVEAKIEYTQKLIDNATSQLKGYMEDYLEQGFIPFGATIFGLSETEIKIVYYCLDEESNLKEFKNEKKLDNLNYFAQSLVKLNYAKRDKSKDIMHVAEREVKGKFAIMHEAVRNHSQIPSSEKIMVLNACAMALRDATFRTNLENKRYADVDFSRFLYTAINSIINVMTTNLTVHNTIQSAIRNLNSPNLPMNKLTVPYSDYMSSYKEANTSLMSIPKFVSLYVLEEILKPLEAKYKGKNIDIFSILYNEFLRYSKADAKDNGVVLTPSHITKLMSRLAISKADDVVVDLCTGSGAFLIAAKERRAELVKTQEEKDQLNNGYIGCELQGDMFFLAFANFLSGDMNIEDLHFGNCYDFEQAIKDKNPTAALLNPPYSMFKKEGMDPKLHEWSFVLEVLSYLPKNSKLLVIVPTGCGISEGKTPIRLKKEILNNHTLSTIISVNSELFYPAASVATSIYEFIAGIPHDDSKDVFVVDYSNDGFVTSNNNRIPEDIETANALYEELIDILKKRKVSTKTKIKSNFIKNIEIDDWSYCPNEEVGDDFIENQDLSISNLISSKI